MCEIRVVLEFWKKSREHTSISSYFLSLSLYVWPKRGVNEGDASSSSIPTYTHTAKGHSTEHNPSRPTAALQLQRQKSRARFERLATCNMNLTRNAYKTRIACLAWGLLGITLVHIWFCVWSSSGLMPDKTKKKTRASSVRRVAFFGRVFLSVSFIEFYFIDISNSRRLQAKLCQCQKVG